MLTFIKKKIGIASETEEQGSCCNGSPVPGEAQTPVCGCGGPAQKPDAPKDTRTGCCS